MRKDKSKFRYTRHIPIDTYESQAAKEERYVEELSRKKNKTSEQIDEMAEEFLKIGNLYKQSWESNKLKKVANKKKAWQNYSQSLKFASDKQKSRIKKELKEVEGGLEKGLVFAFLSMAFLLSALFFSIFSLTGYSIRGLAEESFRLGGVALFVLGLVFAFFYFKNKK